MKINVKVKYFSFGFLTSFLIIASILFFGIRYIKSMQKKEINDYLSAELSYFDVRISKYLKTDLINTEFKPVNSEKEINDGKRFLFINFWATWCVPCVEELPILEKLILNDSISSLPINFIFANKEKLEKQKKFINKIKLKLKFYKVNDSLPSIFKHKSIPTTYIFDRDEKVMYQINGSHNWNSKIIKQFLINIQ